MYGQQHLDPRSVFDLAEHPGWRVVTTMAGQWIIAEAVVSADDRMWRIGLTPVTQEVVALIVWRDDQVVHHLRGNEALVCTQALQGGTGLSKPGDASNCHKPF